ncbi:hypothetical protein BKA70DRAFT_693813 [Coprinopsis sp. MPI-PUGE-AT-0042]|nr:hypothetical protein BKA70DRAFT_693813 [Coprinopsis sp. MPI-PUGE-AT-0042]
MEPSASSSTDAALLAKITERNVGVYRLVLGSVDRVKSKSSSKTAGLQEVISALKRMFRDVHSVDPRLFALYFAAKSWDGINASISTYASNRILQTIEAGLLRHVLVSHVARKSAQVRSNMRRTVMAHFQVLLLESNLRLQTSEAQDLEMTDRPGAISARSTWAAFEYFAFFFTTALSALSQLVVLYTAISSMNYIVLCVGLIPPIILHVNPFSLKNMIGFAYTINQDYIRARCLDKLLTARYRQDVVSGNLGGWIVTGVSSSSASKLLIVESSRKNINESWQSYGMYPMKIPSTKYTCPRHSTLSLQNLWTTFQRYEVSNPSRFV